VAYSKVVRYGSFTIPAATDMGPGMIHNKLTFAVQRPCADCYITSFTPDLVYSDGTKATMYTGPMLHHMVLTSQFRQDATCGNSPLGLAGERFFASGDERTRIAFPSGHGYRVRWYDSWNLLVDLMNHSTEAKTVYVQVTYTYRPSYESVNRLRPVWLDIDQCGDSEYSIPAGFSDTHWDWTVNVARRGRRDDRTCPRPWNRRGSHQREQGRRIDLQVGRHARPDGRSPGACDVDLHRRSRCRAQAGPDRAPAQHVPEHACADDVMGIMLGYVSPM